MRYKEFNFGKTRIVLNGSSIFYMTLINTIQQEWETRSITFSKQYPYINIYNKYTLLEEN